MKIFLTIAICVYFNLCYSQFFIVSDYSGDPDEWVDKNDSFTTFFKSKELSKDIQLIVPKDQFIILLVDGDHDRQINLYNGKVNLSDLYTNCRASKQSIFNFFKKICSYLTSKDKKEIKEITAAIYRSNELQYIISDTLTLKGFENIRVINPITNSTIYASKCLDTCSVPLKNILKQEYLYVIVDEGNDENEKRFRIARHPERNSIKEEIENIELLKSIENNSKRKYIIDYLLSQNLELEASLLLEKK